MISDKKWNEILKETDFELSLDELKKALTYPEAVELYKFLDKYKLNMRKAMKLRLEYFDKFVAPCQLDKSDPRYDEFDSWAKYARADSPDDVKYAAEVCEAFAKVERTLPFVEFTGDDILG